jgi:ABC-2 type transport system ATP-binding protein
MNNVSIVHPAVRIESLSRAFRGKQALDRVNLTIPTGSIFGLVGLNGSGKTTLIRHIIGLLRPLHGTVEVLGQSPIAKPESFLMRIGYLTEEDSLPQWMRVGELIDFSRAVYPTWDDAYAKELCEMFGLSRSLRLSSLSKGQRARAGLLVAIAYRPELLVLDEPSRGLDPLARSDILEAIIRTISEDGRTVLFSSHLLDEVDRICDTVALMSAGRILETLTVEHLETRYSEIICRPTAAWSQPPTHAGVFGWRQTGDEWSAVVDSGGAADVPAEFAVIERRDISLSRWFAARAGTANSTTPGQSDSKVIADV